MKFPAGTILTHRKGGTYVVVLTPDVCTLEETREPAYGYLCYNTNKIHVRRATEFEDGRFSISDSHISHNGEQKYERVMRALELLDAVEDRTLEIIQSIGERTGNLDHAVRGVLAALLEGVK